VLVGGCARERQQLAVTEGAGALRWQGHTAVEGENDVRSKPWGSLSVQLGWRR
jgi:hypothetical protein